MQRFSNDVTAYFASVARMFRWLRRPSEGNYVRLLETTTSDAEAEAKASNKDQPATTTATDPLPADAAPLPAVAVPPPTTAAPTPAFTGFHARFG